MTRLYGHLPERSHQFALGIMSLIDLLPNETKGWVIGKQLMRSGTSIGANLREAACALTDAEFASLANIARREAAEVGYWLALCTDADLLPRDVTKPLEEEADELRRILTTVVRKTRQR